MKLQLFKNTRIFTEEGYVSGDLLIEGDRIKKIITLALFVILSGNAFAAAHYIVRRVVSCRLSSFMYSVIRLFDNKSVV